MQIIHTNVRTDGVRVFGTMCSDQEVNNAYKCY